MQRRAELLDRIAVQRGQVVALGRRLEIPMAFGDRAVAATRFVRSHPVLVAAVVAGLLLRRHGLIGTVGVGLRLWKRYRYLVAVGGKLSSLFKVE